MSLARATYFPVTMASNQTISNPIDLGSAFEKVRLIVPTMASGDLYIQAAADSGQTFYRVCKDTTLNNTTSAPVDFIIPSSVSQRIVPIPSHFRYLKLESSSGCTDVVTTFKIIVGG